MSKGLVYIYDLTLSFKHTSMVLIVNLLRAECQFFHTMIFNASAVVCTISKKGQCTSSIKV